MGKFVQMALEGEEVVMLGSVVGLLLTRVGEIDVEEDVNVDDDDLDAVKEVVGRGAR